MTAPARSLRYESDNDRRRARDAARAIRAAERARHIAHIPGAKQFQIPRCASCGAPLCDSAGEPRWDLLEERFVCLGRCVGGRS